MKRRLTPASRSDLIWTLAAFVGLQLGFAVAVEFGLLPIRDPHYSFAARKLRQRNQPNVHQQFTVVMLGSSRVQCGLDAQALERQLSNAVGHTCRAFNFGMSGAGPINNLVVLRRCCDDGIRPDLLLVEILPSLLADTEGGPAEARYAAYDRYSLDELELLERYGYPISGKRREWIENWPFPAHVHRAKIQSIFRGYFGKHIDEYGWRETSSPKVVSSDRHRQGIERAKTEHHACLQTLQIGGPACVALRDLVVLCRQQQINLALVWMPEGPTFRGWYPPGVLSQVRSFLADISGDFGTPVIDAREWVDEDRFMDSHHLLASGAAEFTARLGREVSRSPITRSPIELASVHQPSR
jgi:hypothetical protein